MSIDCHIFAFGVTTVVVSVNNTLTLCVCVGVSKAWAPADSALTSGEARSVEWLCSGNLLSTVLASMTDLVTVLSKARQTGASP